MSDLTSTRRLLPGQ